MRAPALRLPVSLGGRLLLGAAVLVGVALLLTGVAVGFALQRFIGAQVDGRLDGQILAVADALRPGPPGEGWRLDHAVDGPPFDRPGSGWTWEVLAPGPVLRSRSLEDGSLTLGAIQAGPPAPGRPPAPGPSPSDSPDAPPHAAPFPPAPLQLGPPPVTAAATGPGGETLRARLRVLPGPPGPVPGPGVPPFADGPVTVVATAPLDALQRPFAEAMTPFGLALLVLAAVLLGGGALQVRLGLAPLRRLRAELAAVRAGRAERVAAPMPTEVQPLVNELNSLLDQHAANLERARRHVANLAHSLKTPLATLDLALAEAGPDEAAGRLRPLVAGMDRMIRHHLARARAAALGGAARARTELGPRVADHADAFRRIYADKALALTIAVPEGLAVACEAQDLDEILGNLLDNACRWAKGAVAVRASAQDGSVRLTVGDDGPGLTGPDAATVLRPGHRLDESAPGYGFGLPITRELAELYGGAVALGRDPLGGLGVEVTLPRALA